ncbi:MAG: hypothetical protein OEV42_10790 [Deltaproteobacteria bacterium]|nr:hypothetical protein [Deltaproteobacteria bacterium]
MRLFFALLFVTSLFINSCNGPDIRTLEQRDLISKKNAEEIAKNEFLKLNYGPLKHFELTVTDKYDKNKWSFFFMGKGAFALPGNHVSIDIDKQRGKPSIMLGE